MTTRRRRRGFTLIRAIGRHLETESVAESVAGRIILPAPTPPDMRVRIRRFRLD